MTRAQITTGCEYALYWLAVNRPDVLIAAEQHTGIMLANNQTAAKRALDLADAHPERPSPSI